MKTYLLTLIFAILIFTCQARIITVDVNGSADFTTIQAAINDANNGDEVVVYPGIYTGPGNRDITFRGKAITVRSTDPNDWDVVEATIIDCNGSSSDKHCGFEFINDEGPDSVLSGLMITNGYAPHEIAWGLGNWVPAGGGIYGYGVVYPTIRNCIIEDNKAIDADGGGFGGGIYNCLGPIVNCIIRNNESGLGGAICGFDTMTNCTISNNLTNYHNFHSVGGAISGPSVSNGYGSGKLVNCLVIDNSGYDYTICGCDEIINCLIINNSSDGYTIFRCDEIINCTIANNSSGGFSECSGEITNCVVWGNEGSQLYNSSVPTYSCIQDWSSGGVGNISSDPCFADTSSPDANEWDYHLQSEYGRWDPNSESWVIDSNTSLTIDAGDPNSDWTEELWPHGKRINIGAYGGTAEASMSSLTTGNIADLDSDGSVDCNDLDLFSNQWPVVKHLLAEDMDRNGKVDIKDYAILAKEWLWEE